MGINRILLKYIIVGLLFFSSHPCASWACGDMHNSLRTLSFNERLKAAQWQAYPPDVKKALRQTFCLAVHDPHPFVRLRALVGLLKIYPDDAALRGQLLELVNEIYQDFGNLCQEYRKKDAMIRYVSEFYEILQELPPSVTALIQPKLLTDPPWSIYLLSKDYIFCHIAQGWINQMHFLDADAKESARQKLRGMRISYLTSPDFILAELLLSDKVVDIDLKVKIIKELLRMSLGYKGDTSQRTQAGAVIRKTFPKMVGTLAADNQKKVLSEVFGMIEKFVPDNPQQNRPEIAALCEAFVLVPKEVQKEYLPRLRGLLDKDMQYLYVANVHAAILESQAAHKKRKSAEQGWFRKRKEASMVHDKWAGWPRTITIQEAIMRNDIFENKERHEALGFLMTLKAPIYLPAVEEDRIMANEAIARALPVLKGRLRDEAMAYCLDSYDRELRLAAVNSLLEEAAKAADILSDYEKCFEDVKNLIRDSDTKGEIEDIEGYINDIRPLLLYTLVCFDGDIAGLLEVVGPVAQKSGLFELYRFFETAQHLKTRDEITKLARIYAREEEQQEVASPDEADVKYWLGRTCVVPLTYNTVQSFKFPEEGMVDEERREVDDKEVVRHPLKEEQENIMTFGKMLGLPIFTAEIRKVSDGDVVKDCLVRTEALAYYDYAGNAYPWLKEAIRIDRHRKMCKNSFGNIITLFRKKYASSSLLYLSHLIQRPGGEFNLRHGTGLGEIDNPHRSTRYANLCIEGVRDLEHIIELEWGKVTPSGRRSKDDPDYPILQNLFEVIYAMAYSGIVNRVPELNIIANIYDGLNDAFRKQGFDDYENRDNIIHFVQQLKLDLTDPHDVFWVQRTRDRLIRDLESLTTEIFTKVYDQGMAAVRAARAALQAV